MEFDTIAAISTPMGEGAIGIVRLSGENAISIANQLFHNKQQRALMDAPSHTIHYGHLIEPESEKIIEEVIVSVMRAPNSFTREDIVEINCHGGLVSVNKVLQLVLVHGARLAEPGEFTKRAFLNGRIDLSQAEAVMDLIRAKTDRAMSVALEQVEGKLSIEIKQLRQEILEILAQVEVNIDYPEYEDVEEMTHQLFREKGQAVRSAILQLLKTANQGKILREGLTTVIIGRPNVGKSSLLNQLLQEEKAIVTDIAGTTRDVIEEYVNINGVPLKLMDTAGIRETSDAVEKIGVARSKDALAAADLVLYMISATDDFTTEDEALLASLENKNVLIILNKTDLPPKIDLNQLTKTTKNQRIISTSLLKNKGIEILKTEIERLFFQGEVESADLTYVSNARHIALLHQALSSVDAALESIDLGIEIDLAQIDMTKAWEYLGEIIGENVHESLINQLFSQFCLGK